MAEHAEQLAEHLVDAAAAGDLAAVRAALAAGADPNRIPNTNLYTALIAAVRKGQLACVQQLLAAGADPNAPAAIIGWAQLHWAADADSIECIVPLLAAGADPAAEVHNGFSALNIAVNGWRQTAFVKALLAAAPQLALRRTAHGLLPLDYALRGRQDWEALFAGARCLMEHGALPPAGDVLTSLNRECQRSEPGEAPASLYALYATLVARTPLTPGEWQRMPVPCFGLGAALPAVLARSEAEARALVRCLPDMERGRLRAALLCIRLHEKRHGSSLPAELLNPLLLVAAEPWSWLD